MAARGYQNYHGKKNRRRILLIAAMALVLLLCIGYLAVQNYIVYNADGSVTLDLPFLRDDGEDAPPPQDGAGSEIPIEILRPPEEKPEVPEGTGTAFSVEEVSLYDLWDGLRTGPGAGAQGLVVEVKSESGVFYYQSDWAAEGAADPRALSRSGAASLLAEQRDWSAVAAIHCLRDDYYAMSDMEGAGICQTTGYIWFGVANSHWLDPAKPGARAYLCGVAAECRDMGFDEVLLRSFGYPTRGNLYKIDDASRPLSKEEALELLLEELREALGEEVLLSVELTADQVLAGQDSGSGVDLSRIVPLVDRLYVTGEADRAQLEAAVSPLLEEPVPEGFLVLEDSMPEQAE